MPCHAPLLICELISALVCALVCAPKHVCALVCALIQAPKLVWDCMCLLTLKHHPFCKIKYFNNKNYVGQLGAVGMRLYYQGAGRLTQSLSQARNDGVRGVGQLGAVGKRPYHQGVGLIQ